MVEFATTSVKLAELLTAIMRCKHEGKIVAALDNWSNVIGPPNSRAFAKLESIATDERPAVAAAAALEDQVGLQG